MKRDLYNVYPTIGVSGDFARLNPVENIVVEILSILLSSSGEKSTRMWNIDFGSNFLDYIFSLSGKGVEQAIANEIVSAIRKNLDDVPIEIKGIDIKYGISGKIVRVKIDIGIKYDDKEYIVTYNLPSDNDMLLEQPLYAIKPLNAEVYM